MNNSRGGTRVLVTCPPMLGMMDEFRPLFTGRGIEVCCPEVVQIMTEEELCGLVPGFDGWIIGDDPASGKVLAAGRKGRLRAAVKWGVGTDNVDLEAARRLGIPITNTPGLFGADVADVAMGYVAALARETFLIDRGVRTGSWPKPRGISLRGKRAGVVGFGHIGRALVQRLLAAEMAVVVFDPALSTTAPGGGVELSEWPRRSEDCDFLIFTCALNRANFHMLDREVLSGCKQGVRIVNVARGPLIDEAALAEGLADGRIHSAALDVMEREPLPPDSPLRAYPRCVFGSHNGSNTVEGVRAASMKAIEELCRMLELQ